MTSIRIRSFALAAALFVALPLTMARPAHAGCGDLGKTAQIVQKVLNGVCSVAGSKFDCSKIQNDAKALAKLVKKWNKAFKNGNLTIGPRNIDFRKTESGTIIAGTKRTFISTRASTKDHVVVDVTKRGGKAATVTVCEIDANGARMQLHKITLGKNVKNGTRAEFVVGGVKGKVIVVQVDAMKRYKFAYNVDIWEK